MADVSKLLIDNNTYDIKDTTARNNSIFSTSEKIVGKWINNKPIYRKVVTFGASELNTSFNHNISNIETIISATGMLHHSYGWKPISTFHIDTSVVQGYFAVALYNVSNTDINVEVGEWYTSGGSSVLNDSFIVLEYTKTTD